LRTVRMSSNAADTSCFSIIGVSQIIPPNDRVI